jgi:uncharacterized protein (DUF1501 family)
MKPNPQHIVPSPLSRREMIQSLSAGLGSIGLASLVGNLSMETVSAAGVGKYAGPALPQKAKHVICLFMAGGPSQLDMFDPKPDLAKWAGQRPGAVDLRTERSTGGLLPSPFKFQKHGKSGVEVSEIIPELGSVIDDVCVIRSMYSFNPTHLPGRNLFHSGSVLATRPSIGSWVSYGLGTENANLPSFIVLTPQGSAERSTTRSGFLPPEHQGIAFNTAVVEPEKMIPDVRNQWMDEKKQRADLDLLQRLNQRFGTGFGQDDFLDGRIKAMESAFRMQSEATDLFDVRKEPEAIRTEYGTTPFGNGCLLARRLVESGVRYVQVNYDSGQPWDDHVKVEEKLRERVPDMDRASAALIRDLKRRGLLDETLVVWGGEFGRTPVSESGTGRDHNPYGYTMFVAGGGFKGGLAYGATDEFGFKAVENRVSIHDLHATLMNQLGMDHTQLTYRYAGRDFRLTDVYGEVVRDILA